MLMEESQAPFAKDKENSFQQVGTIVKPLRTCWILSKCQTWVGGGKERISQGPGGGGGIKMKEKGKLNCLLSVDKGSLKEPYV